MKLFNLDWKKIEDRVMALLGGWRVCKHRSHGQTFYYICTGYFSQTVYLWKDGTISGSTGYESPGLSMPRAYHIGALRRAPGFWVTLDEANSFLENWKKEVLEAGEDQ